MKKKLLFISALSGALILSGCGAAQITDADKDSVYQAYDNKLQTVIDGMNSGWENGSPSDAGISDMFAIGSPNTLGFALYDVNEDGMEELLLLEDWGESGDVIYDMFTAVKKNGKMEMVQVFDGGERNRLYLDTNGQLVNIGSNGADDSFENYMELKNGKLVAKKNATPSEGYVNFDMDYFSDYVTTSQEQVGMENPWVEMMDADALREVSGYPFQLPEDAKDVHYYWNQNQKMAQVIFGWSDDSYTARIASTGAFEDISGLQIAFTSEEAITVSNIDGMERRGESNGLYYDNALWYDAVPGLMYSMTAASFSPLEGFDITPACSAFYVQAQGDADGDAPQQ